MSGSNTFSPWSLLPSYPISQILRVRNCHCTVFAREALLLGLANFPQGSRNRRKYHGYAGQALSSLASKFLPEWKRSWVEGVGRIFPFAEKISLILKYSRPIAKWIYCLWAEESDWCSAQSEWCATSRACKRKEKARSSSKNFWIRWNDIQ